MGIDLILLLFYIHSRALASSCEPQPFAVPIKDVQVDASITDSFMRGIPATIGTPEQNILLAPWPDLNNTWIYDEQTLCDSTVIFSDTICQIRRGKPYLEASSESFIQALDIIAAGGAQQESYVPGAEAGVEKLIGSSLGGSDSFALESSPLISKLPIGIPRQAWDIGYTTLHALGLGANSTYLNALRDAGRISARAWSIFWGRMWTTDNPLDGAIVFGGYDQRKVIGQNHTQALDYGSTGCWTGMRVNIANIFVNYRTGGDQSIFPANTALPVCIVPQRQLLIEVPGDIYGNFETVTNTKNIGVSFGLHWSAHLFDTGTQFDGDITIVLDSGLSIRIPNNQYVVPFVTIDRSGSRVFNESQREVLISGIGQQLATVGRYFLTASYLMVDHDAETFTLWQANPTSDSELVPIKAENAAASCSADAATTSGTSSDTASASDGLAPGAIAGAVIGVLAGLVCVAAGVYFLLKRRKRRNLSPFTGPAQESGFKHELHGTSSQQVSRYQDSKSDVPLVHELHQTPKVPPKDVKWTRSLYEMG